MAKILIIDDEVQMCRLLDAQFTAMEHDVCCAQTLSEGLEQLLGDGFDVVFLDVNLPDGSGLDAIGIIQDSPDPPEIIIMTGASDPEGAELAMSLKVWDYIQKGGSIKGYKFSLVRALTFREQKQARGPGKMIAQGRIKGGSSQIKACLAAASKAAENDIPVLISGETGTGKELFARAIHKHSARKDGDFVVVDCASLPDHLVESILFGHVKGSFTSADADRTGLIKLADKGTLFLDEIGELSMSIQKKFLRALQEKRVRPVGAKDEVSCDFRLVSATHRDLLAMIKTGEFREDLYYRISSTRLQIPPLRRRKDDILELVRSHMDRKKSLYGGFDHELSQAVIEELEYYDWPGNVRELLNAVDHACSDAGREGILFPTHLPEHIRASNIKSKIQARETIDAVMPQSPDRVPVKEMSLKDYVEKSKARYLEDLMVQTGGDIKKACRLSGLSTGHLYSLLKKYQIRST